MDMASSVSQTVTFSLLLLQCCYGSNSNTGLHHLTLQVKFKTKIGLIIFNFNTILRTGGFNLSGIVFKYSQNVSSEKQSCIACYKHSHI